MERAWISCLEPVAAAGSVDYRRPPTPTSPVSERSGGLRGL